MTSVCIRFFSLSKILSRQTWVCYVQRMADIPATQQTDTDYNELTPNNPAPKNTETVRAALGWGLQSMADNQAEIHTVHSCRES